MSSNGSVSGRRLDSWKEIASHFGRDVRTVQRWEEREGLPVHRHQHDTQVSVYAHTAELDAWLARRRPVAGEEEAVKVPPSAPEPARARWYFGRKALLGSGLVIILAVSGVVWLRGLSAGARLGFQARDWVLLAGFENRTGEPLFDGTLQYALERELSGSRFVNVVPRERANDALRLMRKPLDAKIDVPTAREICLRDGGIKAMITGRAEKYGSTYVFSLEVLQPGDGRALEVAEEQAAGQEQVWPAVRKLSNWVRQALGEHLAAIKQSSEQLQQVTTPSLRALQLYTQAEAAGRGNQWGASQQLVRQALEYDPEFASGWIWLAWCLRYQGKPIEEYRPFAEKAVQLSAKAGERERLFILGSSYQFAGQDEKASEAYSALASLYPDDFWARRNWIYVCSREEYPGLVMTYADLRPNDYSMNVQAALGLVGIDVIKARRYLEQARALTTPETGKLFPAQETTVKLFPVHESWLRDDPKSGIEELSRLGQSFNSLDPVRRELFAQHAGLCYLGFGKMKAAEGWFKKIDDEALAHDLLALTAYAGGNEKLCREQAAKFRQHPGSARRVGYFSGVALARVGPVQEPQKFIEYYKTLVENIFVVHLQGELALSQGRIDDAIHLLQLATDDFRHGGNTQFLISSDGLALAFERHGEPQEALRVLEAASEEKFMEFSEDSSYGVFWLRIQAHLAQLYRQIGRAEDARKVEDQLRRILAYADSDHPILQQLKHST